MACHEDETFLFYSLICLLFAVSGIYLPTGLVAAIALIVIGFLASMVGTLRDKGNDKRYQKLGSSAALESHRNNASYQASSEYALPTPKQKVVTYCVIDGRLVDQ